MEGYSGIEREGFEEINYNRMDLIRPEKRKEMLQNLRQRTGLDIHRIKFQKIDLCKNVVSIHAFYYSQENESIIKEIHNTHERLILLKIKKSL